MALPILKKKPKRVYKLEDINKYDISLLRQAANMPKGDFFCFGMAWYKLLALNLVDEETNVTHEGLIAIRSFQ